MRPRAESRPSFEYPRNGLLQLRGVLQEDELRHPTMLDKDGESCLLVLKNGNTSGLTMGRASGITSFVRWDDPDCGLTPATSEELAIHPYSKYDGPFSEPGDSGSVVADSQGRIAGILTGGSTSITDSADISYATPYHWLEQRIKDTCPGFHLYPIVAD